MTLKQILTIIKSLIYTKEEINNNVVTLSTDQTIKGTKTFTNVIYVSNNNHAIEGGQVNLEVGESYKNNFKLSKEYQGDLNNPCFHLDTFNNQFRIWGRPYNDPTDTSKGTNDVVYNFDMQNKTFVCHNGNLGASNSKWNTINGLEPSLLSLPYFENEIKYSIPSNQETYIVAPSNGWFRLNAYVTQLNSKFRCSQSAHNFGTEIYVGSVGYHTAYCPCRKGDTVALMVVGQSINCSFFPCYANI